MLKAYVDFRMPDLFLDEIKRCSDAIEDKVVRVTTRRKLDTRNPHCRHVHTMATAIHNDMVLRLIYPVGMTRGEEKKDAKIEAAAEKAEEDLVKQLEEAGMDVRHGVIWAVVPEAA